ncbi:hypothetical protein JHK85_026755 [Glycine max]|nr:hypothetical protein JHK85_026755 [Glycine max]KAG5014010.1 hypothetical protein JHK86_026271 [Glycine max]
MAVVGFVGVASESCEHWLGIFLTSSGLQPMNPTSAFIEPIHEIQFEQVLGPINRYTNYPNTIGGFPMQTQLQNTQQTLQQGLSGFHHNLYGIRESSLRNVRIGSPVQNQFPNTSQTLHGGVLGIHHNSYEIGESSSSRNVRMRMTIEEPQLSSSLYPTGQVSRNPSPPWAIRNTLYDPSYALRGLASDPHLRCLSLENAANHGNGDRLGSN